MLNTRSVRMRVHIAIDSTIDQVLFVLLIVTVLNVRLARMRAHIAIDCMIDQVPWHMKVGLVRGPEFCNPFSGAEQVQSLLAQL